MISAERMAAVDRNAEALGVPRRQLMESSGNAIAGVVREMATPGDSVTIVCGRGNNGGDGFVAARFLEDFDVSVHLLGRIEDVGTAIASANLEALLAAEHEVSEMSDSAAVLLPESDLFVDAIVGTGVTGALREPAATAVEAMNRSGIPVLAVDVPSGLDADTGGSTGPVVAADRVVTFHERKPGLASLDVPVTVADIGIPSAAEEFVGPGDVRSVERNPESHKGDAGRILVIGGGPYTGAPALTAEAALRAGADLGIVAAPARVAELVQGFGPDLIAHPLPGERFEPAAVDEALKHGEQADCVVLGPGLGDAPETLRAVREFLRVYDGRCVVDADALSVVPEVESPATLICTPHQGELEAMGGPRAADWRERRDAVEAFAAELGAIVLVKGRYDVISDGDRTRVSRTGHPGMTVGGTGDVLAGATAAFAVQQKDALTGAAIGAYVNGLAGERAAETRGNGLLASEVAGELPKALREVTG